MNSLACRALAIILVIAGPSTLLAEDPASADEKFPPGCTAWAQGGWGDNCFLGRNGNVYEKHGSYTMGVQRILKGQLGYSGITGDFDANTEDYVNAYQFLRGLSVDGVVGTNTWSEMRGDLTKTGELFGISVYVIPGYGSEVFRRFGAGHNRWGTRPHFFDAGWVRFATRGPCLVMTDPGTECEPDIA